MERTGMIYPSEADIVPFLKAGTKAYSLTHKLAKCTSHFRPA